GAKPARRLSLNKTITLNKTIMRPHTRNRILIIGTAIALAACSDSISTPTSLATKAGGSTAELAPTAAPTLDKTLKHDRDARIVSATGDITAAVNEYRDLLGSLNPNVKGQQPGGRREINW